MDKISSTARHVKSSRVAEHRSRRPLSPAPPMHVGQWRSSCVGCTRQPARIVLRPLMHTSWGRCQLEPAGRRHSGPAGRPAAPPPGRMAAARGAPAPSSPCGRGGRRGQSRAAPRVVAAAQRMHSQAAQHTASAEGSRAAPPSARCRGRAARAAAAPLGAAHPEPSVGSAASTAGGAAPYHSHGPGRPSMAAAAGGGRTLSAGGTAAQGLLCTCLRTHGPLAGQAGWCPHLER